MYENTKLAYIVFWYRRISKGLKIIYKEAPHPFFDRRRQHWRLVSVATTDLLASPNHLLPSRYVVNDTRLPSVLPIIWCYRTISFDILSCSSLSACLSLIIWSATTSVLFIFTYTLIHPPHSAVWCPLLASSISFCLVLLASRLFLCKMLNSSLHLRLCRPLLLLPVRGSILLMFKVGHTPNGRSTRKDWFWLLCIMIYLIILLYVLNLSAIQCEYFKKQPNIW